ncbi:META domain-containing protein [Nocardioides sp. GY 10127]|uniref:META domain-containing protein n=1 Tax=Nocardioides sp. GY 10127 TaxID=2569762 RepID=UPI0010A7A07B|nr:META domain-containing protein [Nocardioides sp. GY 10127]TIC81640.1 META domain-containing protein [Nocardioides sp. GY 10127]
MSRPAAVVRPVLLAGALALVLTGTLTACVQGETDGGLGPDPMAPFGPVLGQPLVATRVDSDVAPADADVRLTFDTADGTGSVSGSAGCNTLFADASVEDDVLSVGPVGGTEMACPGRPFDADVWLSDLLTGSPTVEVVGTQVTLRTDSDVVVLSPVEE